jgi:hypothetical protein
MQDDADRLGPWTAMNGRMAVSEELAIEKINNLVAGYLQQLERSKGAPRLKDAVQNFEALHMLAGLLAATLEDLDDFTRSYLHNAGSGIAMYMEFTTPPMAKAAKIAGLPKSGEEEPRDRAESWVAQLRALQEYIEFSSRNLAVSKGIADLSRPDKGGSTDLYKHLYGTPQWNLVTGGRFVFEMFKPRQAKGTEGGAFHLFLQDIFEFATGKDPEEDGTLLPFLKSVPAVYRRMDELSAVESALIREQHQLRRQRQSREELDRRSAEICERQRAIYREKYDLWPKLYPYTYGRNKAG